MNEKRAGKKRAPRKKKVPKKKKRTPRGQRALLGLGGIAIAVCLLVLSLQLCGSPHRMEGYEGVAGEAREDLLYLTYIDSLRADEMAAVRTDDPNLPRAIVRQAGVPRDTREAWGLEQESPNDLYMHMNGQGRLLRPGKWGLLKLIKESQLFPGYIIFGQVPPITHDGMVNFCGILTDVSRMRTRQSTVLCRLDGKVVHTRLGELSGLVYFGAGVPGHDLAQTYGQHFLLRR